MSYITDHPTHYNWRPDVAQAVKKYRSMFPNRTSANSYFWHPPYDPPNITRRYDDVSVDFWGPGGRGDSIPRRVGHNLFNRIWNDPSYPLIYWIIWDDDMWVRGRGWMPAPYGPPDSDWQHRKHLHITFL